MHARTCPCRNCTGRVDKGGAAADGIGAAIEAVLGLVAVAGMLLARFVAGRVLFRPASPWDATYQGWAPPVPEEVTRMRGVGYPRSSWARRPGYQRQAVRLLAVLVFVAGIVAPLLTTVALGGALLAGGGVALALTRGRSARHRERVAPDGHYWGFVPASHAQYSGMATAGKRAVPPYAHQYLRGPYVQTPYVRNEQVNVQDKPPRIRATATRLDKPNPHEGRR